MDRFSIRAPPLSARKMWNLCFWRSIFMCNFPLCRKVDKPCARITSFPFGRRLSRKVPRPLDAMLDVLATCCSRSLFLISPLHWLLRTPERSSVCVINYTAFSFGVRVCTSRPLICCHFHASERSIFHGCGHCCCSGFKRFPRSARRDRSNRRSGCWAHFPSCSSVVRCDVRAPSSISILVLPPAAQTRSSK